ncbi:MAG TPA: WbqC family protein [Planctomycetota bacterium]|nr:WbqC family protein [Planctomycetota bacterium]
MMLTGHQPNYLPYPGLFEKIARADRFVVVDDVQFVKRGPFGWIHRNRIRTTSPQGWDWLSIPVLTSGKFTQTIREAKVDDRLPWTRKHWRSLEWNYRKAKYFAEIGPELRALYERPWTMLCDVTVAFLELFLRLLGIRTPVDLQSRLGVKGESTGLIVNLSKAVGADVYLSGAHGRDYLDPAALEASGVRVEFQDWRCPEYPQCQPGPFIPNLSIVDVLFNCGPDSMKVIRGDRAA